MYTLLYTETWIIWASFPRITTFIPLMMESARANRLSFKTPPHTPAPAPSQVKVSRVCNTAVPPLLATRG